METERVSLFDNGTGLRINYPQPVGTYAKIAALLHERLSYAERVIVTPYHVDITFVDKNRVVSSMVAACAVIGEVLDLPVRSTWSVVMDTEMLAALMPYADFTGSAWFVPLDTLDEVICRQDSCL